MFKEKANQSAAEKRCGSGGASQTSHKSNCHSNSKITERFNNRTATIFFQSDHTTPFLRIQLASTLLLEKIKATELLEKLQIILLVLEIFNLTY